MTKKRPAPRLKARARGSPIPADDGGVAMRRDLELHREELATQNQELRRANDELRRARARSALLYDVAPVAYFTLDAAGTIVEANLAGIELLKSDRASLVGHRFDHYVAPAEREGFRLLRRHAIEQSARAGRDTTLMVHEQSLPTHVVAAPLGSVAGPFAELLLCVTDETTRKKLEHERREAEARRAEAHRLESLGLLAGGVAHDFNNLLAIVLTCTDLALNGLASDAPSRSAVLEVRDAAACAADLSKQMLAYSGGGRLGTEDLDASELVRSMASLLRTSVLKAVSLELDLAEDLPVVVGDAVQLRQIVLNLVANASEAIGAHGGRVVVRTRLGGPEVEDASEAKPSPFVVLEVTDDGPGMSDATLRRAFDPFFSTKFTGRGLGLAVVHGNTRSHGGTISIDTLVGRGTTFRVALPARRSATRPPVTLALPPPATVARGVVLVVDDEPRIRRMAAMALDTLGFETCCVEDGDVAISKVIEGDVTFVAVLLDLIMPHRDGRETLVELKRIRPGLPVIMTSGFSDLAADLTLVQANGFLPKPYDLAQLESTLRLALQPEAPGLRANEGVESILPPGG